MLHAEYAWHPQLVDKNMCYMLGCAQQDMDPNNQLTLQVVTQEAQSQLSFLSSLGHTHRLPRHSSCAPQCLALLSDLLHTSMIHPQYTLSALMWVQVYNTDVTFACGFGLCKHPCSIVLVLCSNAEVYVACFSDAHLICARCQQLNKRKVIA